MSGGIGRRGFLAGGAMAPAAAGHPPAAAEDAAGGPGARVVAERRLARRLKELTLDSPALGSAEEVALLLPHGWQRREPGTRWPVLYLLAGGDGDHTVWDTVAEVGALPELRDILVVMPGMPLFGLWTDWWNYGAGGPPQVSRYLLREVMPLMERAYGAGTVRAIAGDSQGGFGALHHAARHPGLFRAVAALSAPSHPPPAPGPVAVGRAVQRRRDPRHVG
jgi:S-formylglutathione hydrolase FrmB